MNLHWHRNHPKSTVYVRVCSWWCTFCGFWQMCSHMYSLQYHTELFFCPKQSSASPLYPSLSVTPGNYWSFNYWSFYYHHSFALSRILYSWSHALCGLFRLAAFNMRPRFLHVFPGQVAFFFLALNNILLLESTIVYPSLTEVITFLKYLFHFISDYFSP